MAARAEGVRCGRAEVVDAASEQTGYMATAVDDSRLTARRECNGTESVPARDECGRNACRAVTSPQANG